MSDIKINIQQRSIKTSLLRILEDIDDIGHTAYMDADINLPQSDWIRNANKAMKDRIEYYKDLIESNKLEVRIKK